MAAAIAANPDMPVPAAAISVHPESPPELGATAKMVVVTEGPAEAGLFACATPGVTPVEGNWGPAIAAEGALVPAVVVIVTVTVAVGLGEPAAPGEPATPAGGVAVPAELSVGVGAAAEGVIVGENTVGVGDAPGELAR